MKKQDKIMLQYLDEISYDDILNYDDLSDTENNHINENFEPLPERQACLKSNTIDQLSWAYRHSKRKFGILAAGILVCIILSALTPIGNRALAEIAKKLYFIPGLGKAEVERGEDTYILAEPVKYETANRVLTIESIIKTSDSLSIRYSGPLSLTSFGLIVEYNGVQYTSTSSTRGSSIGIYYYTVPEDMNRFHLYLTDTDYIPITLTKAESFEDYTQMGPTDVKNQFGLTLIPYRLNQQIQFDLVQHQTNRADVSLYGVCDKEGRNHFGLSISDDLTTNYELIHPDSYMGTLSSFSFEPANKASTYTIQIPKVTLEYPLDNELTLPMPKEGETVIHQDITLVNFPLTITKIIRNGDLVTVYVDTHYSEENSENINYLIVDMEEMNLDYYHWNLTDQNTTDFFEFYIDPKQKKLKLKFEKLYTVLKGPWIFEFPKDMTQ